MLSQTTCPDTIGESCLSAANAGFAVKKLITILMLCLLIPFFATDILSQTQERIEKYSKIKITIRDKSDLKELQKAGLSLEGMKLEEESVELIVG